MPYRAVNTATGQTLEYNAATGTWAPPTGSNPAAEAPSFLGGAAYVQGQMDTVQRAGSRATQAAQWGADKAGLNVNVPQIPPPNQAGMERRRAMYPKASLAGEISPTMVAGPRKFIPQLGTSMVIGALTADDPGSGALWGAGGTIGGRTVMQTVGRGGGGTVAAVKGAGKGKSSLLPSGIRTTTGQALDSEAVMKAERSLARNPVTAGPFTRLEKANRQILHQATTQALEVSDDLPIPAALSEAYEQSVQKIHAAIPDSIRIRMPDELTQKFKKFNSLTSEMFDFPTTRTLTGAEFRQVRSELLKGTRSASATVASSARKAIDVMDDAASKHSGVDMDMFTAGRRQYRAWKAVSRGRAVSNTGDINETTLRSNLRRIYGDQTDPLLGNQSTGNAAVDHLQQAAADKVRVGNPAGGSITAEGMSLPMLAADFYATGGMGTVAGYAGSRALQNPSMAPFVSGAMSTNVDSLSRLAGWTGREAGLALERDIPIR